MAPPRQTVKDRQQQRRTERLADMADQVASGSMTVRRMNPDELAAAREDAARSRAERAGTGPRR